MIITIPRLILFVCICFGALISFLLALVRVIRKPRTVDTIFVSCLLLINGMLIFIGALEYIGLSVHFPIDLSRVQIPLFIVGLLLPYFYFAHLYKPFYQFKPKHLIFLINPTASILICLIFNDDFFFSYKIMGIALIRTAAIPTLMISVVLYTSSMQFFSLMIVLFVRILRLIKYGSSFSKKFLKTSAVLFASLIIAVTMWVIDRVLSLGFLPYFYLYAAILICIIFVVSQVIPLYEEKTV